MTHSKFHISAEHIKNSPLELETRNRVTGTGEPGKSGHVKSPRDGVTNACKLQKDKCRVCSKCTVEDCICYLGKLSILQSAYLDRTGN